MCIEKHPKNVLIGFLADACCQKSLHAIRKRNLLGKIEETSSLLFLTLSQPGLLKDRVAQCLYAFDVAENAVMCKSRRCIAQK